MTAKTVISVLVFFFMLNGSLTAQEEIGALRSGTSSIDKAIYSFEDSVMFVAERSSAVLGKVADSVVSGGQQLGTVLFRPIIQNIDPRKWYRKGARQ